MLASLETVTDGRSQALVRCVVVTGLLSLGASDAGAAQGLLWESQFGTNKQDVAFDVAADSSGVFVVGSTEGNLGGPHSGADDWWVGKVAANGSTIWIKQFGSGWPDYARAAAPDGVGGVAVAGETAGDLFGVNQGGVDIWVTRFNALGAKMWDRQIGTPSDDFLSAAAPDGNGGTYVCGFTLGALGAVNAGGMDAFVARLDGAGVLIWVRQIGTFAFDAAYSICSDGSGGAIVGGTTLGVLSGAQVGGGDAWMAHLDGLGTQTWIQQFGSTMLDEVDAIAATPDGKVIAAGSTLGDLGGVSAGSGDAWLALVDSGGGRLWTVQFGSGSFEFVTALALDTTGGAFLGGMTEGSLFGSSSGGEDAWMAHFSSTGSQLWSMQFGTSLPDRLYGLAPDGAGGAYLAGFTSGNLWGNNAGGPDIWVARTERQCSTVTTYCVSSGTSIPGCVAALGSAGAPSIANPQEFSILSSTVPGNNIGILLFGTTGSASSPFGSLGGQLCIKPPVIRTLPKSCGGSNGVCDGSFSFSLQDLLTVSSGIQPGAQLYAQLWARDAGNQDGFLLSNAMTFGVCY